MNNLTSHPGLHPQSWRTGRFKGPASSNLDEVATVDEAASVDEAVSVDEGDVEV